MIPLFSITGCGIYQHSNRTQAMYLPWPSLSPVSHSFVSQQLHSLRPILSCSFYLRHSVLLVIVVLDMTGHCGLGNDFETLVCWGSFSKKGKMWKWRPPPSLVIAQNISTLMHAAKLSYCMFPVDLVVFSGLYCSRDTLS